MKSFASIRAARCALCGIKERQYIPRTPLLQICRPFHISSVLQKIETHTLSDIGEGVKEVQIIQWFVEEGATVEEWAPLCEVQSDKASVEITSKFAGVVKKLHFERDAVVQVGDAMLDIEVEGEDEPELEQEPEEEASSEAKEQDRKQQTEQEDIADEETQTGSSDAIQEAAPAAPKPREQPKENGKHSNLATPAVRSLLRQHGLEVTEIEGSGRDGRVMKEDVQRHLEQQGEPKQPAGQSAQQALPPSPIQYAEQEETPQKLTPIQSAMFKSMTKSLAIPHFLYSDSINITSLSAMRSGLNARRDTQTTPKFSYMPFVIKAVSLALNKYPLLNARLELSEAAKPGLLMRKNHNIGIAIDTPAGLLVPVIKTVNARSITSIAHELQRLAEKGATGRLSSEDLSGGTITVSNIGNIGGGVVAPVIVEGQLAIMGMGRIKATPVFAADGKTIEKADMLSTSWSADHRVVDGATMARMATLVQDYLERPETMLVDLS
ncbi:hypothetical protein LTR51_004302 [Lithohypha guttulata]|nr:hypothetical protein LTR51_004302 [Lithohypha guttulata]